MIEVVDLAEKFSRFSEHWYPKIVGELNDAYVKLVKLKGEFVWHRHEAEDEMLLVMQGVPVIKLRGRDLVTRQGQFVIIPKGVEHLPAAAEEVQAVLLEPRMTVNARKIKDEKTVEAEWI